MSFNIKTVCNQSNLMRHVFFQQIKRLSSVALTKSKHGNSGRRMGSWQINSYGELEELQYLNVVKIPIIKNPKDVLIKVEASSVNPIDVAMIGGYGAKFLNVLRCNTDIEFPLTFGRDFSGKVVQKGLQIESLELGDSVFGVVPVHNQGCHSEYVVVDVNCLSKKPSHISNLDAGGILYAGLTAWSGIYLSGMLGGVCGAFTSSGGGQGKRVLVLGGSGGVGSSAIQILKAENASVVATCSTDAIGLVEGLGVDHVIDYTNEDSFRELVACGPYDLILDCAGKGPELAAELPWKFTNYVTFSSPLLKNVDRHGVVPGMVRNALDIAECNLRSIAGQKGVVKWGYFVPAPHGIEYLKKLVERNQLVPVIDSIYTFDKTDEAYKKVADGHLRGKVLLDISGNN